jgi:mRNA interferase HigB
VPFNQHLQLMLNTVNGALIWLCQVSTEPSTFETLQFPHFCGIIGLMIPNWEQGVMHIISRKTLKEFWEQPQYADAEQRLRAWYKEVTNATWKSWTDITDVYRNASPLHNDRVVFNICGNKYRLVVWVLYKYGRVLIRFIGTHDEYDRIDASTI